MLPVPGDANPIAQLFEESRRAVGIGLAHRSAHAHRLMIRSARKRALEVN